MPVVTIEPKKKHQFAVSMQGTNLVIRSSEKPLTLGSHDFRPFYVETGDGIDVAAFNEMYFENPHDVAITINFEVSDLRLNAQSQNNVVVQRIIEPIQFEASVKVEDGLKVEMIASGRFTVAQDATINAGAQHIIPANPNRKQLNIQVLSDNVTTLRVGDNSVSPSTGILLRGSLDNPASATIETSAGVVVLNTSSDAAVIAVAEVSL